MRIYIAGPMRKRKYYNFAAFDRAAELLRKMGHEPVSPADVDRALGFDPFTSKHPGAATGTIPDGQMGAGFKMREIVMRDITELSDCDALVLLPGWSTSIGAKAELAVARWLCLPIYVLIKKKLVPYE